MANRNPAAESEALGQLGDQVGIEACRVMAGVDMHVDVDVELSRKLEDAVNLSVMVDVVVGGRTDHLGASAQSLDECGVGAGSGCQPFLREEADFEVDRPRILAG